MTACPFCASSLPESSITCPSCGATLSGLQLELGMVLLGKYRLEEVLGQGGFGITYKAFDLSLNRFVAIKELFPEGCTRNVQTLIPASSLGATGFAQTKQRFLEEAQTLAQFNHAGIVRVFEVFEANNTAYIVMEALSGETLGAVISKLGQLPEKEVIRIAEAVCAALEVVHQTGLLHRDIKPDNLYITTESRVVLIDFGSARGFQAGRAMSHTQLVSPGYAAPEQYASQAKFGTYTDVYGLSAMLFHAAIGKPPPTASDRIISSDTGLHLPSSLQEPLRTALTRGLALRIDERPQTAKEFVQLLETPVLQVAPVKILAPPSGSVETIIFRSDRVTMTTKQLEIKNWDKNNSVTTYQIGDIESVMVTNDKRDFHLSSFLGFYQIAAFGVIAFGTFSAIRTIIKEPIFSAFLTIPIALLVLWLYLAWNFSQRDTFYILVLLKPYKNQDFLGMITKFSIFSTTNQKEAERLAQQIRLHLTP